MIQTKEGAGEQSEGVGCKVFEHMDEHTLDACILGAPCPLVASCDFVVYIRKYINTCWSLPRIPGTQILKPLKICK